MAEKGLPLGVKMRHDTHFVEELSRSTRTVGKILPVDKIVPNPNQPRADIGDLTELSASIGEKGVLEPLLVKPCDNGTYMIIAGERRWHASKLANLEEVPCIELDLDERGVAEIALVENLQRKDLTVWEVADGLADLGERFDYTHDEIAERIGKSRSSVTEALAIANLPEKIRGRCVKGEILAKSVLVEISRQFDEKAMDSLVDEILRDDLKRTEIRQKARAPKTRAASKRPACGTKKEKGKKPEEEELSGHSFHYASKEKDFDLTLTFKENTDVTRKELLIALKEVFDGIKTGRTSV